MKYSYSWVIFMSHWWIASHWFTRFCHLQRHRRIRKLGQAIFYLRFCSCPRIRWSKRIKLPKIPVNVWLDRSNKVKQGQKVRSLTIASLKSGLLLSARSFMSWTVSSETETFCDLAHRLFLKPAGEPGLFWSALSEAAVILPASCLP